MTEVELAEKFIEYYRDYDVYKEVPTHYGRCDIVVKAGPIYIFIEVKKQFSTDVIYQALRNMPFCNYSYVAVPLPKDGYAAQELCKRLGIGVLYYDKNANYTSYAMRRFSNEEDLPIHVREFIKPGYRRVIHKPRLLETMKDAIAGAQHNSMSEFKVTLSEIEAMLKRNGGSISAKELFKQNKYHYSSSQSAKQTIVRLCNAGAITQFSIDKGVLKLTEPCTAKE